MAMVRMRCAFDERKFTENLNWSSCRIKMIFSRTRTLIQHYSLFNKFNLSVAQIRKSYNRGIKSKITFLV